MAFGTAPLVGGHREGESGCPGEAEQCFAVRSLGGPASRERQVQRNAGHDYSLGERLEAALQKGSLGILLQSGGAERSVLRGSVPSVALAPRRENQWNKPAGWQRRWAGLAASLGPHLVHVVLSTAPPGGQAREHLGKAGGTGTSNSAFRYMDMCSSEGVVDSA